MGLKDYLLGVRVVLSCPLSVEESASRINSATASIFNPFAGGVTGWSRFGYLYLCWNIPFFSNGFRPVFRGSIRDVQGKTQIRAEYGASPFVRVFGSVWYGLLTFILASALSNALSEQPVDGDPAILIIVLPLFYAVPVLFHFIFNRNANDHLEAILALIRRETGAQIVGRSDIG